MRDILIVDGYNMIGAWPDLQYAKEYESIETARDLLLEEISNYAAYNGIEAWVVFDAQFVPGQSHSFEKYRCHVVFTAEGQTADSYIEGMIKENLGILNKVVVATSDLAEQRVVFHQGAIRKSARELLEDVNATKQQIRHGDSTKPGAPQPIARGTWSYTQLQQLRNLLKQLSQDEDNEK